MVKNEKLSLQMECTLLFQSHPYMIENLEGLALRLGRKIEDIKPVIELLIHQQIIKLMGSNKESPLYCYNEPVVITDMDIKSELNNL